MPADLLDPVLFAKSVFVGLAVAAPVGPVGVFCIDKTLREGFPSGLSAGLGATLADVTWALAATILMGMLLDQATILSWRSEIFLAATPVLLVLGSMVLYKAMHSPLRAEFNAAAEESRSVIAVLPTPRPFRACVQCYFLTLSNPLVLLNFSGWVAWLGFGSEGGIGVTQAVHIVVGVFVGAIGWWYGLCTVVKKWSHRANIFVPVIDYTCVVLTFGAAGYSFWEAWPAVRRLLGFGGAAG